MTQNISENKLNKFGKTLYVRKGELVGAGYFVHRRGNYANRIKPSKLPFEHPTLGSALLEKKRLEELNPQNTYSIFKEVFEEEL